MKKGNQIIYLMLLLCMSIVVMQSCKKNNATTGNTSSKLNISDVVKERYDKQGSDTSSSGGGGTTPLSLVDAALNALNWMYFSSHNMIDSTGSDYPHFSLHLPSTYTSANSRVYIIGANKVAGFFFPYSPNFPHKNYPTGDQSTFVNYIYGLPDQSQWKLLAISFVNGQFYYGVKQVQITDGGSASIDALTQITEADLANVINNL